MGQFTVSKKARGRLHRNVTPYQGSITISLAQDMDAKKCACAQMPYPTQSKSSHTSSKVGEGGTRGGEAAKDRGKEADGKKGSPTREYLLL